MTEEQIIKLVDDWIAKEGFHGGNCDYSEFDDNRIYCDLEHPNLQGWMRRVAFDVPEWWLEDENEEDVKEAINNQMKDEIYNWGNDNEDMYRNIALASGFDDSQAELVEKAIDVSGDFFDAQEELKGY